MGSEDQDIEIAEENNPAGQAEIGPAVQGQASAESGQNPLDNYTNTQNQQGNMNAQNQTQQGGLNPSPISSVLSGSLATSGASGKFTFNNYHTPNDGKFIFSLDSVQAYNQKWQENFPYILGPYNPAFVNATLSYRDAAFYHLEYNPNGVLWRVSAAGIPHPDDYNNYIEQNRVIESTTNRTVADMGSTLGQTGGSNNGSKSVVSSGGNDTKGKLTKDNISEIIKKLRAEGITGITIGGQYIDIRSWKEQYTEIQKKIEDFIKNKNWGKFSLLKSDYSGPETLVATGKYNATPMDFNFSFGYNPFPFFYDTPEGTVDYYFSRAGKQAYHMLAADALSVAPTTATIAVITLEPELAIYYKRLEPVMSAVCEVEKNMHLHWEEVDRGTYTYSDSVKHSLLPLGLELGPAGYTAENLSKVIVRKYGLPEVAEPVLKDVLSKIIVNNAERFIHHL